MRGNNDFVIEVLVESKLYEKLFHFSNNQFIRILFEENGEKNKEMSFYIRDVSMSKKNLISC